MRDWNLSWSDVTQEFVRVLGSGEAENYFSLYFVIAIYVNRKLSRFFYIFDYTDNISFG
jgi:hypothetical protein